MNFKNFYDIKKIGNKIKSIMDSDESYRILDLSPAEGGTWQSGGCLMLGKVLQKIFGGKLKAITVDGIAQHVVVELSNMYLDSEGLHTKESLLKNWIENERLVNAIIQDIDNVDITGINYTDDKSEKELEIFIRDQINI